MYWIHSHYSAGASEILIGPLYFLSDHFLRGEVRVCGLEGGGVRVINCIPQVCLLPEKCALSLLTLTALINRDLPIT